LGESDSAPRRAHSLIETIAMSPLCDSGRRTAPSVAKHRQALNRGYVLLPLAAPHHRRDGLVCFRPCTGQVVPALFPAAVEAIPG